MGTIQQVTAAQARAMLEGLTRLLQDAVESGASVGFLPPLDAATAHTYWGKTINEVQHEERLLWVACQDSDIVGTVQLALALQPNARHRAEVQKLIVHTRQRRQGLGQALMRAVEDAARRLGRSVLVLDTRRGDVSEVLYQKLGYTLVGSIPQYARSASGALEATAIYYRLL
jgi:ribosomal protein S18 acetylase RimI-like enzyme